MTIAKGLVTLDMGQKVLGALCTQELNVLDGSLKESLGHLKALYSPSLAAAFARVLSV